MVVVVGGGYAGRMAVVRLRAAGLPTTLVDPAREAVERTRLHEAVATGRDVSIPLGPWAERIGATHVRGRVVGVERDRVWLASGEEVRFDHLVVAAGSVPDRRGVAGLDALGDEVLLGLATPEQAAAAHARLETIGENRGRVAVVGAGLTGIELAAEIAEAHPDIGVTLIGAVGGPGVGGYSDRGQALVHRALRDLGVAIVEARAHGVDAAGVETDRGRIDADAVAWAGGMRPAPWLAESGLPTDASGRVVVAPSLVVAGLPNVVAAGDCAATGLRMACATAMPAGCHAAATVLSLARGEAPAPFRFGYALRCVSLGRSRALVQGTRADDTPTWAVGGRAAAALKETILIAAARMHRWEAGAPVPLYGWPRAPISPLHPPAGRAS